MKIHVLALVVAFSLVGCAAKVVSSSERSVVVNAHPRDAGEAQALADEQCSRYGRKARMMRLPQGDRAFLFDCER